MPWGKFDDALPEHPKVRYVGSIGLALFTRSVCYSNRWLTNGFVPRHQVNEWAALDGKLGSQAVNRMMEPPPGHKYASGLWETADGGILVHDFLDYNPSKSEVLAERAAVRGRKYKWKERRSEQRSEQRSERLPEQSSEHSSEQRTERVRNGEGTDAHARAPAGALPSRPVPSRPVDPPPTPPDGGAGDGNGHDGSRKARTTKSAAALAVGKGPPSGPPTRATMKLRELHATFPDRGLAAQEFEKWRKEVGEEYASGVDLGIKESA